MVHFDHKLAHVDSSEDLVDNLDTLCVRDHGIVLPGNVEVTLVKLPEVVAKISVKLVFFDVVIFFANLSLPRWMLGLSLL